MDTPKPSHPITCWCQTCKRLGAGIWAQRSALQGDPRAAVHMSPAVFAFLKAEGERIRLSKRGKVQA